MNGIVLIFGLDFVVDVLIQFLAIFDGKVDNDIEADGFIFFVKIKAMHFEDALMRKDDSFDVLLNFANGFIVGVN